jgi:HEAT repeat protein
MERALGRWTPDRALAIELCGEVKAKGSREQLESILKDPKDACRGAAARGLGRLGDASCGKLLLQVLEDAQAPDDLRLDAAEGLFILKHPEVKAEVERILPSLASSEAKEELRHMVEEYL